MKRNGRWLRAAALTVVCTMLLSVMPLTASAAYENTYVNTGNQAMDIIGVAKTQLGYAEGSNNNNKYAAAYGNANQPWCGFFISWCARQAKVPTAVIPDTGSSSAFKSYGKYHARTSGYIPKTGDIMYYDYDGDGSPEHVSLVERYDAADGKVWVIDGNWSDKVSSHSATLSTSSVMGFTAPSYTSAVTELSAFNLVTPSIILKGKGFSIGGMVCSPKNLTKVTVTVQDADGNTVISQSAAPNAKTYDVAGLDSKIKFGSLVAGEYMYTVSATDESGASKRWANAFEVVSEVTMTIADVVAPTAVESGKTFSISGKITCPEPLTQVAVGVYDSNNVYKTGGTAQPNATSYDIKGVDKYVSFGSLADGAYTMRVSARSANAYKTWEYPFTVGDTVRFVVSGLSVPETVILGQDAVFAGKVECNMDIVAITAKIFSGSTELQSAILRPNAKTCQFDSLNDDIDFSKLKVGSYRLRLAANRGSTTEEWFYPFTVTDNPFTLSDEVVPTVIKKGVPFDVYGVVSYTEALDKVTLEILTSSGSVHSTVSATPGTASYEIRGISDSVPFSKLSEGDYTFRVAVTSGDTKGEWLFPFKVMTDPSTLKKGDLNFDGKVNISDASLLYQHVSGKQTLNALQLSNVGIQSVNISAAMKLFRLVSGATTVYP